MLSLTHHANSYSATPADKRTWADAKLGPEDVRWLYLIADLTAEDID